MKYKCLILDHDDTVADSTRNVHYPSFMAYMKLHRPNIKMSLEEYVNYNFDPGVVALFQDICGLSEKEMKEEENFWFDYCKNHVSKAFDGMKELMEEYVLKGGILTVVSHSFKSNILKDYDYNKLPMPSVIYGWEEPKQERKPSAIPVLKILEEYCLKKEEVLVVDDLKPGLLMARSAGVDFAAAGWCFDIPDNEKYLRENADYYCKSIEDLKRIVLG